MHISIRERALETREALTRSFSTVELNFHVPRFHLTLILTLLLLLAITKLDTSLDTSLPTHGTQQRYLESPAMDLSCYRIA